jgi:sulfatase maturation enzyme AslB (radical SAM superfamily)
MANILLTNYCNRQCEYCFAAEKMGAGDEGRGHNKLDIHLTDFETYLEFLRRSRLRTVSIIGGEPTLNPHFHEILDLCRKDCFFTHIKLFTNGLMPDHVLEYLAEFEGPELSVALNIHHPSDYLPVQWERIENALQSLGSKIGLGYNIYHRGNDFGYILELFHKYQLQPHIRLGLAQPVLNGNNLYLQLEDFSAVAEEIVKVAESFTKHDLFFSFDCGFPFCMFTIEQHKKLLSCAIHFRSLCSPIIDIGPDLSVWRCFSLSGIHNRRLDEFETRADIDYFYQEVFRPYRQFGIYPECLDCNFRKQGLCTGGCLSRVMREFHGGPIDGLGEAGTGVA